MLHAKVNRDGQSLRCIIDTMSRALELARNLDTLKQVR
jgi:hypothetical protein